MAIGNTIGNFAGSSQVAYENFESTGAGYVNALRAKEEEAALFTSREITHKLNQQMDAKLWSNTKSILDNRLSAKA